MPFDPTILKQKIEGLKEAYLNGNFGDALVSAINTGNGLMQQRIFTNNSDVNGRDFGRYISKSYRGKRTAAGRQVARKDLEFTGGLRRSIETQIVNEKSAVIQFNNDQAAVIAKGKEQQIANIRSGIKGNTVRSGVPKIFALSPEEKQETVSQGAELIKQILKPK